MRTHDYRWTAAWLFAVLALLVHVIDEVAHGSFGLYEDVGRVLLFVYPSLDLPYFNRDVWFVNLGGALAVLFGLTWLVWRGRSVMIAASYVLAMYATLNGMLHFLAVAALKTMVPGALSAPLLVAAGLLLFIAVPRGERRGQGASPQGV